MHPTAWARRDLLREHLLLGSHEGKRVANRSVRRIDGSLTKEGELIEKRGRCHTSTRTTSSKNRRRRRSNTQKVRDMEIQTNCFLEEHRRGPINWAIYELNLQESEAASTAQSLEQQLRQHNRELSSRGQDCETSRNGQLHLFLQNYETMNMLIKKLSVVCPKKWKSCGNSAFLEQNCVKRFSGRQFSR